MRWLVVLVCLLGCKRVTSTSPDETDARQFTKNLNGTWALDRVNTSAVPQPPRTVVCPEFSTGFQPTRMMIADDTLTTDGGRPVGNLQLFGAHDVMFDESERWFSTSEGILEFVIVYYQIDQRSSVELRGMANAIVNWEAGACAYSWSTDSYPL
jgi:hypothetical protein